MIMFWQTANAQNYLGAGNYASITVSSSSSSNNTDPENTINGKGMDAKLMEASRFLSQTTFGSRINEVERLVEMGYEAWIDEQMNMPANFLTEEMWNNWDRILAVYPEKFHKYLAELLYYRQMSATQLKPDSIAPPLSAEMVQEERDDFLDDTFGPSGLHFNNIWWHNVMTKEDQLRQRVAYALSQIFVVSSNSDLGDEAESLTAYYDILLSHSFGNFRDLLEEITLSPAMGFYLSHLNNSKEIPEENIHPDENYAREIMQLFTIGLFELNLDGTRIKDSNGNDIPTYNNADIKELARIFTGLGPGELDQRMYDAGDIYWTDEAYFGLDLYAMSKEDPMIMYQEWHDTGSKELLNGLSVPAGQLGLDDIAMTLDYLFNHPNIGPFFSRRLIQRLVKSNPSPEYIERVSTIFNNNGNGERGDLAAVIKAILLDPEARGCESLLSFENGKLSEPLIRHSFISKMADLMPYVYYETYSFTSYDSAGVVYDLVEEYVDPSTTTIDYWNNGYEDAQSLKQYALMSPTVFNFYLPDHQPVGELTSNDLYGPEYKILDSSTAINYLNSVYNYVGNPWWNNLWWNWEDYFTQVYPNYDRYTKLMEDDLEKLIQQLDIEFTKGQMTDDLRDNIRNFVDESPEWVEDEFLAKYIIYLIMISPDYTIEK